MTRHLWLIPALLFALLALPAPAIAGGGITFEAEFAPSTIGPGSATTLSLSLAENAMTPQFDLALRAVLPAAVQISTPASASNSCGGVLTAPAGGTTIELTDGNLAANASCSITVVVTSETPGAHTFLSGDLTSAEGNHGSDTAVLLVDDDRPGVRLRFARPRLLVGESTRATIEFDNTQNALEARDFGGQLLLPLGLAIASVPDVVNSCGGSASTSRSPDSVGLAGVTSRVAANDTCEVAVTVTAVAPFEAVARTGVATTGSPAQPIGFAIASIAADPAHFTVQVIETAVSPGAPFTLRFTVDNPIPSPISSGAFSLDIGATRPDAEVTGPLATAPCGPSSTLGGAGTAVLTLSNAALDGGGTCTFDVAFLLPGGEADRTAYPVETSPFTATTSGEDGRDGVPLELPGARTEVLIGSRPRLEMSLTPADLGGGSITTLQLRITNDDPTEPLTATGLTVDFSRDLPGTTINGAVSHSDCGPLPSTTMTSTTMNSVTTTLTVKSVEVGPAATCTITVPLLLADGAIGGRFTLAVDDLAGSLDGRTIRGGPAEVSLRVRSAPTVVLTVLDGPVPPGGTSRLQVDLLPPGGEEPSAVTEVGVVIDLADGVPGMQTTATPQAGVCGAGNGDLAVNGTSTTIAVSGVSLPIGSSCTFTLPLLVPVAAVAASYTIVSEPPTAVNEGVPVTGTPGSDVLDVTSLLATEGYAEQPALPGETVTRTFTLRNVSDDPLDSITFSTKAPDVVAGATFGAALPATPCGPGSSLTTSADATTLFLSGGQLDGQGSCPFDVPMDIPANAIDDTHPSTTGPVTYRSGGIGATAPGSAGSLTVDGTALLASKSFLDDPVRPLQQVTLRYVLTNGYATRTLSAISFTDELDSLLTGLTAMGLPRDDVCGPGSRLSGTTTITLSGGALNPGLTCAFDVTLALPGGPDGGGVFASSTSDVLADVGPLTVVGAPARDDLTVSGPVAVAKSFSPAVVHAGGQSVLTYTLTNSSGAALDDLRLSDALDAVLSGLAPAAPLPVRPCGATSMLTGTTTLQLRGASLTPTGSCTFQVTLAVPAGAPAGTFTSRSSAPVVNERELGQPATATLEVEPPPTLSAAVSPTTIGQAGATSLTLTIDNRPSSLAVGGLALTLALPAGLSRGGGAPTTTCGGTLSVPDARSVGLSGGTVGPATTCTVTVPVTGDVGGTYDVTTSALGSSAGASPPATAQLVVTTPPALEKSFLSPTIVDGATTTLVLRIDNRLNAQTVDILELIDPLPSGMRVAATPAASSSCRTGTIDAAPGATSTSFTGQVAAGQVCQVDVDVIAGPGTYRNETRSMQTSLGRAAPAVASLTVNGDAAGTPPPPPTSDLSVSVSPRSTTLPPGGTATLTFSIANAGPQPSGGTFSLALPAGATVEGLTGCTSTGPTSCAFPTIAPGGSTTITTRTIHREPGTGVVAGTVASAQDDPAPAGNRAEASVRVSGSAPPPGEGGGDGDGGDGGDGGDAVGQVIDTAVALSQERFPGLTGSGATFAGVPTSARFAVLARADVFADALAGSVLTGDAPLLFTTDALDVATAAELDRVLGGAGTVYLLGGEAALSAEVAQQVRSAGHEVIRLAGDSRVETAIAVADESRRLDGGRGVGVARAYGTDTDETAAWADSVSAGGWAAETTTPILLTETEALHPAVAAWIGSNANDVTIIGGAAAISDAVASELPGAVRVAGDERGATAVDVARTLRGVEPPSRRSYLLVNGVAADGWAYGMLAAGLSADAGAPILLTRRDDAPAATVDEVRGCRDQTVDLRRITPRIDLTDALLDTLDALDDDPCPASQTDGPDGDAPTTGATPAADADGAPPPQG